VYIDLVADLDALVAEPPEHLGDQADQMRCALCLGGSESSMRYLWQRTELGSEQGSWRSCFAGSNSRTSATGVAAPSPETVLDSGAPGLDHEASR
jgi:hypothetical protein